MSLADARIAVRYQIESGNMTSAGTQDEDPVHISYLAGYIVLSYVISAMGCATTLELLHRRTSRSGFYNWYIFSSSPFRVATNMTGSKGIYSSLPPSRWAVSGFGACISLATVRSSSATDQRTSKFSITSLSPEPHLYSPSLFFLPPFTPSVSKRKRVIFVSCLEVSSREVLSAVCTMSANSVFQIIDAPTMSPTLSAPQRSLFSRVSQRWESSSDGERRGLIVGGDVVSVPVCLLLPFRACTGLRRLARVTEDATSPSSMDPSCREVRLSLSARY